MTTPTKAQRPRLSGGRARTPQMWLIEASAQGRITRRPGQFWPDYCLNDQPRPDLRPLVADAIGDGLLVDPTPNADTSVIEPTDKGLAKIGASR